MSFINTLISKVNKASSAIKTTKGIQSKLTDLLGQASSTVDELKEQGAIAERNLEKRRNSLKKNLEAANSAKKTAKDSAQTTFVELQYPLLEGLDNYIVFRTRPRKSRNGPGGRNLLSNESVEIALYVPDGLTSTANVSYKAEGFGGASRGAIATMNADGFMETLSTGAEEIMNVAGTALNKMINAASGDLVNFVQGQAANPMQEQMLDGVQFRSFTFEYDFWPKSPDEADMVNQIIYSFRTAMLPDTFGASDESKAESFFNYPNVFDVELEGPVSQTVDGFLPMMCTKCDVDHFGGGKFATFYDGQSVHTKMSLEFLEIKILTQETYNQLSASKSRPSFANDIGGGSESINPALNNNPEG